MSGTGEVAADEADAAERLGAAPFVRLVAHADGDGLAAAGLLAAALEDAGVPFRARLVRTAGEGRRALRAGGDDAVDLAVGLPVPGVTLPAGDRPASVRAFDVASTLGEDPDPVLALAGVAAAGVPPTAARVPQATAEERGLAERRPGVAVPTADLADGLAHTTLAACPFSGDREAAAAALADVGHSSESDDRDPEADGRAVASLVALSAAGGDAPPRAATAVERALRPLATPAGPFATVGGYGDVLAALARERPGLGLAVALGDDRTDEALAVWRDHARGVHGALAGAEVEREGDVAVARVGDAPAWTAARLLRDFRTTAPLAAAVGDRGVAVAGAAADVVAAAGEGGAAADVVAAAGEDETAAGDTAENGDATADDDAETAAENTETADEAVTVAGDVAVDVAAAVREAAGEGAEAAVVGRRGFVRTDDPEALLAALAAVV